MSQALKLFTRVVVLVCFALLITLCVGNNDYKTYQDAYFHITDSNDHFELLYVAISDIFFGMGFSYQVFLFCISFVALILMSSTVYRYSYKPEMVLLLYFIFPFIIDATQIRNFISMAISIYAFRFLVDKDKYWVINYYLGITIALFFHTATIVLFAIPILMCFKGYAKFILPIIIAIGVIFVYSDYFYTVTNAVYKLLFGHDLTYSYLLESSARPGLGLFLPVGCHLMLVFLLYQFEDPYPVQYSAILKNKEYVLRNYHRKENFNVYFEKYFFMTLILIIAYAMTSHFSRLLRNLYVLVFIAALNLYHKTDKSTKMTIIIVLSFVMLVSLGNYVIPHWDGVVTPFFMFKKLI